MASAGEPTLSRKRKRETPPTIGPYVLKPLLDNVPLSSDGEDSKIEISCVEYWGIMHFN